MDSITKACLRRALVPAAFAMLCGFARPARAEVSIVKTDGWELYTQGRVNAFFSYGWGDAIPIARDGEIIPAGGGLDTGSDTIPPPLGPDGMPPAGAQSTFRSMRLRSGFVPNQLGFGLRRQESDDLTISAYIGIWATIESEAQRKATPVQADAREGYLKVDSKRYGTLTAGKALELFSRGAVENDFLYHDGYGIGFPGNIDNTGPTNGMIGFGVLAAFFSPGLMYATPSLAGIKLSVGVYDPTTLPGNYEATRYVRPEAELTYDLASGPTKLHLFANGAEQKFYKPASNDSVSAYGVGYGGRLEVGPVHLGVAGHYGKGLGLEYAFQPGVVAVTQNGQLRFFDGYSAFAQVVTGPVDLNAGWGLSRVFSTAFDRSGGMNISLPSQQAISGGVVWHVTEHLHLDLDFLHGFVTWSLGEHQNFNFLNSGVIVTW
jgi:hypothetical protein